MKIFAMLILFMATTPAAFAADTAPSTSYVPFSVTEDEYKSIMTYLDNVPYKSASPIVGFFSNKESVAQRDRQSAAEKKDHK